MKRYTFTFWGRRKGAIGIYSTHEQTVDAETEREAAFKLYETHQDISLRGGPPVVVDLDTQRYDHGDR